MSSETAAGPSGAPVTRRRAIVVLSVLGALLALVVAARVFVGEEVPRDPDGSVSWSTWWVMFGIRCDRVVVGLIVGVALAVSGAVLQSLLRNPLASPYVLGVSSGAALGVTVARAGWVSLLGVVAPHMAALGGAVATMAVVYVLAQKRGRVDPVGLLLIGVIVNAISGGLIMFISYLNPMGVQADVVRWMMGHLSDDTAGGWVWAVGIVTALGWGGAIALGRAMDVATLSDTEAHALGLRLGPLRVGLFGIAAVLTAGSVMLAGPIGFVGLICPHVVRLLLGPGHRLLLIGSGIAGGLIVVGADLFARVVQLQANIGLMPVGVLTAIIGGPVFLALLRPQIGRGEAT